MESKHIAAIAGGLATALLVLFLSVMISEAISTSKELASLEKRVTALEASERSPRPSLWVNP